MKQFELQKPISHALKEPIFLPVNFFQIGCAEQSNKTHNFRKIIFMMSSLQNSIGQKNIFQALHMYIAHEQSVKDGLNLNLTIILDPNTKPSNSKPNPKKRIQGNKLRKRKKKKNLLNLNYKTPKSPPFHLQQSNQLCQMTIVHFIVIPPY